MSPASDVKSDFWVVVRSSNPLAPVTVDAGDSDVLEENLVEDRVGKDAKYAYAVASGKVKILRVSRPTLGCRK
jgi:hypothetical protein